MPLPELKLIAKLRRQARGKAYTRAGLGDVLAGVGDDCAILQGSRTEDFLVTTDFSIENIHFRREWHPPESVGHRCLARGLSDIAAMGGRPTAAFLSLGLPGDTPQSWVDKFLAGFLKLARKFDVQLAGGDTAESPAGIVADVIVLGRVPRGKAVLRAGANPGDYIYVSGQPGGASAVLQRLAAGEKLNPKVAACASHFFPQPRIELAARLREKRIPSAMIDLSDGISTDLGHICQKSRVAAELWEGSLSAFAGGGTALQHILHGGEDYELLFTAPQKIKVPQIISGIAVTRIGRIVSRSHQRSRIVLLNESGRAAPLAPTGWQHFK